MKFILNGLKLKISPNPTIETAEYYLNIAKINRPDEIESIGGGSTLDIGKYISWKLNIPHTAIPTTAGSGSEATKYAVFVVNGKKKTFEDKALLPTNYKLKPELLLTLPSAITISSGLDALSHAVESFWSPEATEESKRYSEFAINGITACLYDSWKNPQNEYLRGRMLESANYAGKAINITRTSICHALSYPMTVKYGIPHGIACASTLPIFMKEFNFRNDLIFKTEKLLDDFKIKKPKLTKEDIEEAMESERFYNTPKQLNYENIFSLFV